MTADIYEENFDGYNSDDFEKELKACVTKMAELEKRHKFVSNAKSIYEKRKVNKAASTQKVNYYMLINYKKV